MSSFFDSSFFISNCLSVNTLSLTNTTFPSTVSMDKMDNINNILGINFILSSDLKKAKSENNNVRIAGKSAIVPNGKMQNTTLKTAKK